MQTLKVELQGKVKQLSRANEDRHDLLDATDSATPGYQLNIERKRNASDGLVVTFVDGEGDVG